MRATQTQAATSVPEIKLQLDHPSAEIIWARALEVFGNEDKARRWMDTPRAIFQGSTPQQLSDSGNIQRQREVLEALVAIDYGMYS